MFRTLYLFVNLINSILLGFFQTLYKSYYEIKVYYLYLFYIFPIHIFSLLFISLGKFQFLVHLDELHHYQSTQWYVSLMKWRNEMGFQPRKVYMLYKGW